MSLGSLLQWVVMILIIMAAYFRLVIILLYFTSLAFIGVGIGIKIVSLLNHKITWFDKSHVDRKLHPQVPLNSINGGKKL